MKTLDWNVVNPTHMANEGERLRVLEEQHKLMTEQFIAKLTDHENRIRDIEKTVWKAVATATTLQAIVLIAIQFISRHV